MRGYIIRFGFLILVAVLAGFAFYLFTLPKTPDMRDMPKADAIVVLTGGGGTRIRAAAALLAKQRGQRLLISGVHNTVQRKEIQNLFHLSPKAMKCCVDLGYRARDTLGNADEITAWAQKHGYRHLIVVTSNFHMPRARIELRTTAPNIRFSAYAVKENRHRGMEKWRRIFVEYLKYIVILARETILGIGK